MTWMMRKERDDLGAATKQERFCLNNNKNGQKKKGVESGFKVNKEPLLCVCVFPCVVLNSVFVFSCYWYAMLLFFWVCICICSCFAPLLNNHPLL